MKKLIFSLMLLFLVSLSSVNAIYYYERTESRSADGSYSSREIEFRGSVSGYAEDDDYRNSCTRSERRRYYSDRYYGRGYSDRCGRDYYRSRPVYRYDDGERGSYDIERNYSYDYMGRRTTRTSRY